MIIRCLDEVLGTGREVWAENKSWVSRRILLKDDKMGFSFHDTITFAGTEIPVHYKNHLEAVYCIEGEGELEIVDEGRTIPLRPGTCYALNKHDKHIVRSKTDVRFICVFNPPLAGKEKHGPDGAYPLIDE